MGCSAFNLVVFLIFLHDYKILTERSMSRAKKCNVVISTNEFIPWFFVAAPLLGAIATIAIIKNLITVQRPFNIEDEEEVEK